MLTLFLRRLASAVGWVFSRPSRPHGRRPLNQMLMLDDHLLRDIGLTYADVIECVSSPLDASPVEFLDARHKRNAPPAAKAVASGRRFAA
jgi:uncharacterized protein YjiS (DUF1127 family)